jgi:hypothetical protein
MGLAFGYAGLMANEGVNISLLYVVPVLIAAARHGLVPSLWVSALGVLAYNFFFLPPLYQFTVSDPKTWTAPWTVSFPLTADPEYRIFEYACHEGNYGMEGILSGAREEERQLDVLLRPAVGRDLPGLVADDHVLRHVDEPPREVTRVGRAQRRVCEALAGAVRGDEVLQHRQTLARAHLGDALDRIAPRVRVAHHAALADVGRARLDLDGTAARCRRLRQLVDDRLAVDASTGFAGHGDPALLREGDRGIGGLGDVPALQLE